MSPRSIAVLSALIGAAGLWYFAVLDHRAPHVAVEPAPSAEPGSEAQLSSQPAATTQAPSEALVVDGDPLAVKGDEATTEAERLVVAAAMRPVEEQAPEIQNQYYKGWLEGLQRSQNTQVEMLARLQAEREKSPPALRPFIDERIAMKQKVLQERAEQIAAYRAKVGPAE